MWDVTILHQDVYGNVQNTVRKVVGAHMTLGDFFQQCETEYKYFSIFSIKRCQDEEECIG